MNKSLLELAHEAKQHSKASVEDSEQLNQEQENYRTYKLMEADFYKLLPDFLEPKNFKSELKLRSSREKVVIFTPVYGSDNPEELNASIEYVAVDNSSTFIKDAPFRCIIFYAEFNGDYFQADIPILLENETLTLPSLKTYLRPFFELWDDTYIREVELDKLDKEYEERRRKLLGEVE